MIESAVTRVALSVVLGTAFGAGVCLLLLLLPRWSAPSLTRRIAPYLRDLADPLGLTPLAAGAAPVSLRLRAAALTDRLLGGPDSIARRLRQSTGSGSPADVVAFRARQLAWALGCLTVAALAVVGFAVAGRFSGASMLLPPLAAVTGTLVPDVMLGARAKARLARITDELPTVLEFLGLCLAAGEGLLDALRRVGGATAGDLSAELRTAVLAAATGDALPEALTDMAEGVGLPALTRTVDHLVAAMERGAPLAGVLQAQAQDAREQAGRVLIEMAGRKEIYMMLPLVFLILPLSVLFAVFPGIFILRLGLG